MRSVPMSDGSLTASGWRPTTSPRSCRRGSYLIAVSGAQSVDGMEIPTDSRFEFTVDYAGQITTRTAPNVPAVKASGTSADPTALVASWTAVDPTAPVVEYRYAIGSTQGATDIVNWTSTTATSLTRTGLGLVAGRQYWLSVRRAMRVDCGVRPRPWCGGRGTRRTPP